MLACVSMVSLLAPVCLSASPVKSVSSFATSNARHSTEGLISYQQQEPMLKRGTPIEGEVGPGETKRFRVALSSGQYLRVIVDQYGIDLSVLFISPDAKLIADMDGPYGDRGTESVSTMAELDGEYRVEIRAAKNASAAGGYKIRTDGPRLPNQPDLARLSGERAFMTGLKLSKDPSKDAKEQAINYYKDALRFWHASSDRYDEAKTLLSLARLSWSLWERAAESQVVDYDTQAIELSRQIGDRRGEALAQRHLGLIYITFDPRRSRDYATESLAFWRGQGDKPNEASTLNIIGGAYEYMGDVNTALQFYEDSLRLQRELKSLGGTANLLNNTGQLLERIGEPQEALRRFQQVVDLVGATKTPLARQALAGALNNTAYTFLGLGDPETAVEYCKRSLPLQREVGYRLGELNTLLDFGHAHFQLGDSQTALSFYDQAYSLSKEIGRDNESAFALTYKGEVFAKLRNPQSAMTQYSAALALFRKGDAKEGEAVVLSKMGAFFASQNSASKSLESYSQALAIWRAIRDPRGEAATLYGIAGVNRDRGDLVEAHKNADDAIKIVETLRAKVVSTELRSSYLASVHDYYDVDIDLLMQLHKRHPLNGYDSRALQLSERARARSFLESLGEVGKEIREGVDPNLLERERLLQRQIEAKIQTQIELLKDKSTEEQSAQIEKDLKSLIDKRKATEERIRVQSPRYAALTQPQPIRVDEIQNKLLDPETLLLEYALGEQRSYLWVVSSSQIASYELPGRSVIEAAAKQVYNLVSSTEAVFSKGKDEYWKKAAALSQMILGPVATRIGDKRLVIVTEGSLQYVPFPALPIPRITPRSTGSTVARSVPMIAKHEIISFPSVSVVAALRTEWATRKAAGKGIAVFADPVFDKDDERLQSASNNATIFRPQARDPGVRGVLRDFARYGIKLERLKNSGAEAEAIRLMSPGAKINLGFEANLKNAKSADLGSYRIVHFATHGILDTKQPDLSRIALSLVDERGEKQDGFLLLNDIYNMRLSADLVVLSACSTALGKDIRGEGLVGLTRGFIYAGAARVMASLWNVDDQRTAELMKRFYEKILKEKMQPAAALKAAQLEMWRSKDNSPYYWGAFVIQGEWKDTPAGRSR
jgi:CHAT domain-containing protein/tetratricopeptide (TPR) repeat protein